MQEDYVVELIAKWRDLGHLNDVEQEDLTKVACRLEGAHRRTMGSRGDVNALSREIENLRYEGLIGKKPELRPGSVVKFVKCQTDKPQKNLNVPNVSPRRQKNRGSSFFRQENRTSHSQKCATGSIAPGVTN